MGKANCKEEKRLIILLASVTFLAFLWLATSASPAYADNGGTFVITPGDGGGGTGPPQTIEGWVTNYDGGLPGSGLSVYVYDAGDILGVAYTNGYGYFKFEHPWIYGSSYYYLSVNGPMSQLGVTCENMHWGQRCSQIQTNINGYASAYLSLQPSATVIVPAAALFSNTKYATLQYTTGGGSAFDHTMTFNVVGSGFGLGYRTSTQGWRTFGVGALNKRVIGQPHYAATFWADWQGGIVSTGIADALPFTDWGFYVTNEYITDPEDLNGGYVDFPVTCGDWTDGSYTETSTFTWSASLGIDFSISYRAFGFPIELSTTVTSTSGTTNSVYYLIDRRGDTNPNSLTFRVYTAGAFYNSHSQIGGMELHIWDMSGAG